jgi:hypothetical protein
MSARPIAAAMVICVAEELTPLTLMRVRRKGDARWGKIEK